jgi:hypothetical protein
MAFSIDAAKTVHKTDKEIPKWLDSLIPHQQIYLPSPLSSWCFQQLLLE